MDVQRGYYTQAAYEYNQQSEFITREDADELVEVIKESTPECFNEGSEYNPWRGK